MQERVMAFNIVHRGGWFEDKPSIEMFEELYNERFIEDDEHLSVSVAHESEWYLSLYPDGEIVWENVEATDNEPRHMDDVPKDKVLELWTKLANGDIESIEAEPWLPGYY
ncbi:MAG TPA: hypothetical protein VF656_03325 [Pyrinomonadaceae bacterium]|jgi:hypothetical protein